MGPREETGYALILLAVLGFIGWFFVTAVFWTPSWIQFLVFGYTFVVSMGTVYWWMIGYKNTPPKDTKKHWRPG